MLRLIHYIVAIMRMVVGNSDHFACNVLNQFNGLMAALQVVCITIWCEDFLWCRCRAQRRHLSS